jgi:hypothetical protein
MSAAPPSKWVQLPLPEFPPEIAFLPHSSTISAIRMVYYDWDDLRHAPDLNIPPERAALYKPSVAGVAEQAAAHLGAASGAVAVMLTFGTIVVCPPKNKLPFAGFVTRVKPHRPPARHRLRTSERGGIRFNEDGAKYCIPLHRFIENPKGVGRACLQRAQVRYESCKDEAAAAHTFAAMARSCYPPPGDESSDATVVAIWRRHDSWVALVRCQCFYPGVGVLVEVEKPDITIADICELATTGRELFRRDYLEPSIAATVAVNGPATDEPAPDGQ